MSDLRSARLVPLDSRTHLTRINDWAGSGTWVQMSRRDPGDTPMPEGKTARYVLKMPAFDGVRRLPPGTVVDVFPAHVGMHHAQLPDEKYDKDHQAAFDAVNAPRMPPRIEEVMPLKHHEEAVGLLQGAVADRDATIAKQAKENAALTQQCAALAKENAELKAAADKK